jgi:hypothetical protein
MFTSQNMFVVMLQSDLLDYFQRSTNLAFFQNIGLISAHTRKNAAVEDEQSYKKTIQIKNLIIDGIFEEI